jgi:hypothetical protein
MCERAFALLADPKGAQRRQFTRSIGRGGEVTHMTDETNIPPSAFEAKPWWNERPNDQLIKEIRSFISRTYKPYLWPGQSYNAPPDDAMIDYLDEFFLPPSKPLVPCPCCTPRHPKYRHGMVAYFPNERVIRIMGHDCFKRINSERHTEALRKYHGDIQRKKDIAYLLDNLHNVPDFIAVVERAVPIGHAVDKFRNDTCTVCTKVLRTDLWEHIKTGELKIIRVIPSSDEFERDTTVIETYGRIRGYEFLKRQSKKLGIKLEHAALALKQIDFGSKYNDRVRDMTDRERSETAKLLKNAIKTANEVFAAIHELRQFTSKVTLATLNGWARAEGCPLRMNMEFDKGKLYVGLTDHEFHPVTAPDAYFNELPPLPKLSYKAAAE